MCNDDGLLRAPKDLLLLSLSQLCLFSLSLSHSAFLLQPPPLKYFHSIKQHNFPFFHLIVSLSQSPCLLPETIDSAHNRTQGMVNYDILILDW
ncbi:hypothetical protein VNO80_16456 [Phaseolus coccineus]|uniref:Uncharacterized protein n=1 Tax=Phaseolus coccineus TaxID=3886 RepID=A0AAN9MTB7_PHACN